MYIRSANMYIRSANKEKTSMSNVLEKISVNKFRSLKQSWWVVQSPIKLTPDYRRFLFQFSNFLVGFSVYAACFSFSFALK